MPTAFTEWAYRFFFYSNEHDPKHVHVENWTGQARFEFWRWAPKLTKSWGLSRIEIGRMRSIISKREKELDAAWKKHFP